jgi:hypothetical protein
LLKGMCLNEPLTGLALVQRRLVCMKLSPVERY